MSNSKDIKDYAIPAGAGLLGAVGAYALARSPIWGTASPFFKNLRKTFGNKVSAIFSDKNKNINTTKEKLLSGFDNVTIVKSDQYVKAPKSTHGLTFDFRGKDVSNAASKHTKISIAAVGTPGHYMEMLHKIDPKLIPKTKVLNQFSAEFYKNPTIEEFKRVLQSSIDSSDIKNTVLKIQMPASGIKTPFKTEQVLQNPERFFNKYVSSVKKTNLPLPVYIQQEVPGEVYRATIVKNRVVPGSVVRRYGIKDNILDTIVPSRRAEIQKIEQKLDRTVRAKNSALSSLQRTKYNKDNIPIYNPDIKVVMDDAGRITDLKLIDMNAGLGGNIIASSNPPGNWALTRALTGKQPKVLAAAGAVGVGTASGVGATFIRKKNKEA